jgi:hypothetical protein
VVEVHPHAIRASRPAVPEGGFVYELNLAFCASPAPPEVMRNEQAAHEDTGKSLYSTIINDS